MSFNLDLETRPTMSVDEYAELLEVGRATAYAAVASGEVPSIRIGRRIRIPTAAVRRMLQVDVSVMGVDVEGGDAA